MRLDRDGFREILDSLTRNRSRTLLTGFGVFWGLFMLLAMLGGGKGLRYMLMKNFEGFATNTVLIIEGETSKPYKGLKEGRKWSLDYTDLERLRQMVPEIDVVTPMIGRWGQTVVFGDHNASCSVKGVKADYVNIETPKLKYGRFINETDVMQERKVCVIGRKIYETLFPGGGDPCGEYVKAGPVYFQIIGVDTNAGNISLNGTADEAVWIPLSVATKLFHTGDKVDIICYTGKPGVQMSTLDKKVTNILARNHSFDPTDPKALMLLNTEQLFAVVDNLFKGLNFLIWLVGLGTLLAGVIGVSNIMMVTVRERTIEIGIRRAIGATPKDILSQVMLESMLLTLVAGMSGIVFSVFVLGIADKLKPEVGFQIDFWTAILSALLLALLGVIAGLAPAMRAMNVKPVDAMRDE